MKSVFNNHEVFHIYASKTQESGRNSTSSISFRGHKAYSYDAVIGQRVAGQDGQADIYVLATNRWSPTTTEHQSLLRHALVGQAVMYVYSLDGWEIQKRGYEKVLTVQEMRLSTANKTNAPKARAEMARLHAAIVEIARAYSLMDNRVYTAPPAPHFTPEQLAQTALLVRKNQAVRRENKKAYDARRAADIASRIQKWKAGETVPYHWLRNAPCALRLNTHADEVQTSHGASIPVADAVSLWPLVRRAVRTAASCSDVVRLGRYMLNKISPKGSIVVGCHRIAYEELAGIAQALGLKDAEKEGLCQ